MRYHPRMLTRPIASTSRFARIALLWLALVLAVAQLAAIRHAYSHAPGESTSQSGSKHPGGLAHCDACVATAALGAGAPPCVALFVATLDQQAPPVLAPVARAAAPQQRPYAARAPPAIA
jgi:hypothetical protein